MMHINVIILSKQYISHLNFKRLRDSVGRAHIHVGYIFLKSNEEIVVRNPIFFYNIKFVVFVVSDVTIFTYFTLVKGSKLHYVASWLPRPPSPTEL